MLLSGACTTSDTDDASTQEEIRFEASVPLFQTRSVINSTSDLQSSIFGVFAYYTGTDQWDELGTEGHAAPMAPNFMHNQRVTYSATSWQYSPVKYWPNDNIPADNSGATGSVEHSYLSFFAYAPYSTTATSINGSNQPLVSYTWTNSTDPASQSDLLYANQTDCYKTMPAGYGTVTGRVPFLFRHALTAIEFKVRRKEQTGDPIILTTTPTLTPAQYTQVLTITPTATINTSGKFNLIETTWAYLVTTTPTLQYLPADISSDLRGAHSDDATKTGVTAYTTETAHPLTSYSPNLLLLMPQQETVTFAFTLHYTLGGTAKAPSGTFTFTKPDDEGWALAMGKKYTVIFIIDGGEVESYLLREKEAEQW